MLAASAGVSADLAPALIQSMKSYLSSRLFNQTQIMGETYEELIGILLRFLRQSAEAEVGDTGDRIWPTRIADPHLPYSGSFPRKKPTLSSPVIVLRRRYS
jgi:hypothetical protein